MAELQTEKFRVIQPNGNEVFYDKTDTVQYGWMVGGAGELIIFLVEKHAQFGAVLRDERNVCYAPGTWSMVEVLKEEDDE